MITRYSRPDMRAIWTDENRLKIWLQIEMLASEALVKAALDSGAWWLASAILVSGLLTTVALGRVYTLAFWRDNDRGIALQSATYLKTGFAALIVLMIPIVFIGLYPEPFIRVAGLAASGLLDASSYIGAVFPGDVP